MEMYDKRQMRQANSKTDSEEVVVGKGKKALEGPQEHSDGGLFQRRVNGSGESQLVTGKKA